MMIFLGLSMILMVSGDDGVTVTGSIGQSVILPCPCMGRNLKKDVKWQKVNSPMLVINSNMTGQYFGQNYSGRVNLSSTNRSNDCSVLLTNITREDHGNYKCMFHHIETYVYKFVNLHVCGTANISQQNFTVGNGIMVFQCDLKDCYPDEEILWILNGTSIENSSMNISNHSDLDSSTGLYHSSTTLTTKINLTSKPKCVRKTLLVSIKKYHALDSTKTDYHRIQMKVIPVVLVLGLSLILCFLAKSHRGMDEDCEQNRQRTVNA